jgi:predicted lipid-binding transport protein (Tim44 family)
MIAIISMIAAMSTLVHTAALAEPSGDEAVENAYKAYIQAWKTKDIAALQNLISDD